MNSDTSPRHVLDGEVLPPSSGASRQLRMPNETPLGVGWLGVARFEAIRRVVEARERTVRAIISHIHAETDLDRALISRAHSLHELANVGHQLDCATEERRERGAISRLKHKLERAELEEKIAIVEARRTAPSPAPKAPPSPPAEPSLYQTFKDTLSEMPGVVATVQAAKAKILAEAGGEDGLTPELQDVLSALDQMLQEFIAKHGEGGR